MPVPNPKDVCSACGGQLEYEGGFRRDQYRFDQYRCQSCKKPVEFGNNTYIKDEYPQIREASIEVENQRTKGTRKFGKNDSDLLFCCWNHNCSNPGIYVPRYLQEMLDKHETHREFYHFCDGYESSPKGRKKTPCTESFKITIDLVL